MSSKILDPRLRAIIDEQAVRETLGDTFGFTEGPIWHPGGHYVIFSDIPGNRMHRWSEADGFSVYREPSDMANGNTWDRDGNVLTCEHASSTVTREVDGVREVIASHYDGKALNSPNDIIVRRADGAVFFTDPTYGRRAGPTGKERPLELDFRGVYRIDAGTGELTLMASDFRSPNGLCFGLDQSILFVADTEARHIRRFTIEGDTLTGGDVFAESPAPDGLKIDSEGNVYAGGPGGVHVYDGADGTPLGIIETPAFCANFTWGGPDLKTLFMTASTGFYRIPVRVPGLPPI